VVLLCTVTAARGIGVASLLLLLVGVDGDWGIVVSGGRDEVPSRFARCNGISGAIRGDDVVVCGTGGSMAGSMAGDETIAILLEERREARDEARLLIPPGLLKSICAGALLR
jgi:hypothetical protein